MHLIVKKKVTLVVSLSTFIILGYVSFIAWSIGFLLAKYLCRKTVDKPRILRSSFIPLGKYKIHLHHWLWSSCVMIIFTLFKGAHVLPADLFYGFFAAIVFHGIYCYSDWYKILIRRQAQTVVAKNLALGKFISTMRLSETGGSASTQDEGSHKNMV